MHGLKKLTPRPHHGTNVERPLTKFTKIFCSVAQLFPGSSSPQLVVELLQAFVPRNNILEIRSNVPFTSTFGNPVMWPSKLMHRHHASIEKSHPQLQVASPFQQKKRTKLQMQSRLLSQPKFSTNGPDNITIGIMIKAIIPSGFVAKYTRTNRIILESLVSHPTIAYTLYVSEGHTRRNLVMHKQNMQHFVCITQVWIRHCCDRPSLDSTH